MDPAALMAMMNNGGFGGNGGWWWIWIILIFFCWGGFGGNGFGRGSDDASRLASQLNTDTNTSLLMQAIQGNKDAISTLSNTLSCDINAVQTALNTINTSVSQIACDTKLASCEVINAITSGNANLASQLANCCCQTQRSIDSVNLNLTQMSADNKLSICQQTNTLQNAITGGFNNLMTDNASKFNVIGAKIDAQTQIINDKFCQLEMREMQNKIDTLRAEKSALELGLSQSTQTANIVNQLTSSLAAMENLKNYPCQLNGQLSMILLLGLLQLPTKKKQPTWLDKITMSLKLKKKQLLNMTKKCRNAKIFQINQKHKQKFQ